MSRAMVCYSQLSTSQRGVDKSVLVGVDNSLTAGAEGQDQCRLLFHKMWQKEKGRKLSEL